MGDVKRSKVGIDTDTGRSGRYRDSGRKYKEI
jgi:hypothetical protein